MKECRIRIDDGLTRTLSYCSHYWPQCVSDARSHKALQVVRIDVRLFVAYYLLYTDTLHSGSGWVVGRIECADVVRQVAYYAYACQTHRRIYVIRVRLAHKKARRCNNTTAG